MITAFHAKNFKALRDITLALTPMHVLIGPNDSGKTSILHALAALSRSVDLPLDQSFGGQWSGRELVWHREPGGILTLGADISLGEPRIGYRLGCEFYKAGRNVTIFNETVYCPNEVRCDEYVGSTHTFLKLNGPPTPGVTDELIGTCQSLFAALSGVKYYRWNARMLALPVAAGVSEAFGLNSDGFGLALLLDDILGSDRKLFDELEAKFTQIFPQIRSIKLLRQPAFTARPDDLNQVPRLDQAEGKGLAFELSASRQWVPASQVSDGALLILGYLAVLYSPKAPRLLLIEEPENGIHPKLLQSVIQILQDILKSQSHTQIVLTTHSPYAVDLFTPDEVTLCTKQEDGSVALTRMSESPSVRKQISLFSLGEIWTAEGDEDLAKHDAV